MGRLPARDRTVADRLIPAAGAWAAVLFVVALVLTGTFGWGVLYFAGVPMVLTLITTLLLRASRSTGNPAYRLAALVPIGFVGLAVLVSFILPLAALLPTCALLAVACFDPAPIVSC